MGVKVAALTVFFDGMCPLCSREIEHYRVQVGADKLAFVDIMAPDFDAGKEGLDVEAVHRVMHVRDEHGIVHTKVGAFMEIWKRLPRYQWLYRKAQNPLVRRMMDAGYSGFAIIRPYLPRRARGYC